MKKKIMILGGSILQLPAIKKAIAKGYITIVVDRDIDAVGFKEDGVIKEVISTIDIPSVLECAKKHHINGIMTLASDMPMRTIAMVSKELNLVGISEDTALKATNKGIMRDVLSENNVPVPLYFRINNKDDYLLSVNKIKEKGYKCIVKPADNSGSRGVTMISDYLNTEINEAYVHAKSNSRSEEILVEEFMEGPEVSVETISINGDCHVIQITDKLTTGAPYFVEMGHRQPSQLNENIKKNIEDVAKNAVKSIGIENGPSHTEIIVTKDGPKIVELGARLGGDCITTHLVPLSTGLDMVECCINIAMGEAVDIDKKFNKGSAIKYLETDFGKIKSINGVNEAKTVQGVKQVSIVHGVGDFANCIQSSTDRVGFVVSQGDTADEAISRCNTAISLINIITE